MATKNEMIAAVKDLNSTFGLDPLIKEDGTWQDLLAGLLEFKGDMVPEEANQMKPATYKLLQELNTETKPPVEKKPPAKKPVKKVEAPEFREPEKEEEVKPVEVKPEKKVKTPAVKIEKKETKKVVVDFSKSNKAQVWKMYTGGETDITKLMEGVNSAVKASTISTWISQWKKGNNLPAIAKK